MSQQYALLIQLFGTTDNYNTEQSECLHIDFTKDTYRATNHKDEYSQMTKWLEGQARSADMGSLPFMAHEPEEESQ
jgi:hypothetical protein